MSKVNYDDGNWHPHTGKIPVHPKAEVNIIYKSGIKQARRAGEIFWSNVVAFKVVKDYKEPRRIWVNVYHNDGLTAHKSKEIADLSAASNRVECVKFVEVLED